MVCAASSYSLFLWKILIDNIDSDDEDEDDEEQE
jgi:hypothetical protein